MRQGKQRRHRQRRRVPRAHRLPVQSPPSCCGSAPTFVPSLTGEAAVRTASGRRGATGERVRE